MFFKDYSIPLALVLLGGLAAATVADTARGTDVASGNGSYIDEEAVGGIPNIRIVGWLVDDKGGGNDDGGLHPGESAFLEIHLSNGGSGTARFVAATLSEAVDHPDVTIIDKFALWPDLLATGASATSSVPHFSIQVAATRPCNWQIPLRLEIVADGGYFETREFLLEMRDPQEIDLLLDRPRPAIHGADANDRLASAIASGDFDGDGYDDLVIGTDGGDGIGNTGSSNGEVRVIYGGPTPHPDIDLLSPSIPMTTIYGRDTGDNAGSDVAIGDRNGDGYDDLFIGALGGDGISNLDSARGETYIVYGLATRPATIDIDLPLSVEVDIIYGETNSDLLGSRIAVGDINGDGLADLALGIESADGPSETRSLSGEVILVLGDPGRLSTLNLAVETTGFHKVWGAQVGDRVGNGVALGDLDGDGYDDLVLSQESEGPSGTRINAGGVAIVYGSDMLPTSIDLAFPPAYVGFVHGVDANDLYSTVAVGDFDGDGYGDLAIGAYLAHGIANDAIGSVGEVAVIPGGPDRIVQLDLGSPLSPVSFIHGKNDFDTLGLALATGDVDGDGYDDLLIGSEGRDGPGDARPGAGAAFLIYGHPRGIASLDTGLLSGEAVVIHGEESNDALGGVLGMGDLEGNGFMDLFMGVSLANGPQGIIRSQAGSVVVRPGGPRSQYRHDADTFSWIDTSAAPDLGLSCDDCGVTIPIGFDFDFYGTTHSDVTVSSNGYLTFGGPAGLPGGFCPPATNLPDELIAVFWDDLDLSAGGSVHSLLEGTAPNRRLTIAWLGVPYFGIGGDASFEVTLFETSDQILYQYQDVVFGSLPDNGATAIIGVEGRGGHNGTPMSCPGTGLGVADASAARWRRFANPTLFYGEDVETSGPGWTFGGLWGATNFFGCTPESSSSDRSFYYGQMSCDYETGAANSGSLISPNISNLPQDARLSFRHRRGTEGNGLTYDQSFVRLQVNGGGFGDLVQLTENSNSWLHSDDFLIADPELGRFAPLDLSAHVGQPVDVSFFFDTVDAAANTLTGWMVDDVEIHACPVFGGGGGGGSGVASDAVATAESDTICETDAGHLDAIGSYCASCSTGLSYQWSRDGLPIGGATGIVYDVPPAGMPGTSGYTVEIDCAGNPACMTESTAATLTVVAQARVVANTFTVNRTAGNLTMQWTDVANADDYVLFSSTTPNGAFTNEVASSSSGSFGMTVPQTAGSSFYLVAGRNATCGTGPKN